MVPEEEKTRQQEIMAGGNGCERAHRGQSANKSLQMTNASNQVIALAHSHEAGSSSAITEACGRKDKQPGSQQEHGCKPHLQGLIW